MKSDAANLTMRMGRKKERRKEEQDGIYFSQIV